MAIINGNKYSLPYSGACRLLRSLGPYKIYRIKEKKSVIYAVMRGRKVACFAASLGEAIERCNYGRKK